MRSRNERKVVEFEQLLTLVRLSVSERKSVDGRTSGRRIGRPANKRDRT